MMEAVGAFKIWICVCQTTRQHIPEDSRLIFIFQTLFTGMKGMLEYEADDMEETFVQTFRICYQDVFGTTFFQELKEGGDQIYVCQDNKKVR
jgi:hypothetical protein